MRPPGTGEIIGWSQNIDASSAQTTSRDAAAGDLVAKNTVERVGWPFSREGRMPTTSGPRVRWARSDEGTVDDERFLLKRHLARCPRAS
jgi:hypothetical protein